MIESYKKPFLYIFVALILLVLIDFIQDYKIITLKLRIEALENIKK